MEWWQTLAVALITYSFTKVVDLLISISKEKRDFKKARRERMLDEIEELKDEVGRFYELASNWKPHEMKVDKYDVMMKEDDYLIGKYNKYPNIASSARDVIHWCKIVSCDEKVHGDELINNKKELKEKYTNFIEVCNAHLEKSA